SGLAIILACRFRNNAATRYGILFPAFLSLLILAVGSLFFQSTNSSLFHLELELEQPQSAPLGTGFVFDEALLAEIDTNSLLTVAPDLSPAAIGSGFAGKLATWWQLLSSLPLYLIFACIWIAGFLILTLGLLRSFHNIERISRNSRALSDVDRQRLHSLTYEAGKGQSSLDPNFNLRESDEIESPMLTGLLTPVILLPNGFISKLSEEQLRSVLLHELAHLQRGDLLANFLQKIIASVFWFHPLVHVMDRMISRAREEICDNYVLAEQEPLEYSEALLHVSSLAMAEVENSSGPKLPSTARMAVGMFGSEWKLEQRIGELLNEKRERSMKLNPRIGQSLQLGLVAFSLLLAACQVGIADSNNVETQLPQADDRRLAEQDTLQQARQVQQTTAVVSPLTQGNEAVYIKTQAATQPTIEDSLSDEIKDIITLVQDLMQPEDNTVSPDMDAAKQLLDELYNEAYASMNNFEKSTVLSFYTNYYLALDDYPEAIRSFEQFLGIEQQQENVRLRTLRSLGQLHAVEENWRDSISFYDQWRAESVDEDDVVYRGLSQAYYQLESWQDALEHWRAYMEFQRADDVELNRDDYSYLNGLYFTLSDFDSALETTKEMILLFNDPKDWQNLRAIFSELDDQTSASEVEEELIGALNKTIREGEIIEEVVQAPNQERNAINILSPEYPPIAAQRGIEGWTLVEFTVDERGDVIKESIKVKDSDSRNKYHQASIRAAEKLKFDPRITNEVAIQVPGVKYLFSYRL
ncbi:MAG: hypothetical protein COA96_16555, partial [SAR86 cluster bacterium]